MKLPNKLALSLGALGLVAGIGASSALATFAQTTSATTSAADSAMSAVHDFAKGGHIGQNGKKEELLTGADAEKATAAALASVPGGTIDRVETDAEGDAYEAHMTKADGTHVTVKLDVNFTVTKTEDGPNGH